MVILGSVVTLVISHLENPLGQADPVAVLPEFSWAPLCQLALPRPMVLVPGVCLLDI